MPHFPLRKGSRLTCLQWRSAQAVEGNYKWRVVNLLNGLVQFYEFVPR